MIVRLACRYWTIVGTVYVLMYLMRDSTPQWLTVVLAVVIGARGLVTLSVWLWTHDIREAIRKHKAGTDSSSNKYGRLLAYRLPSCC